ncbi:hypothetical protein BWQ96_00415 [Gracilariopsis chorda]|uniref:Uncharacterized protein n=1 Tax=Gracilariopsis chorda TaxID=448386 RepID=A0A2V3J627_9FLOR|nr:hypothetical protein BWQ96_00415 [Gracilariopsis chorda]|eukprot:PXF49763.1 hypothetical protein BWQ96_00415 [Gracilariopsis chorda]
MLYGEIPELQPDVNEVLDEYAELYALFDDYWKVDSKQFEYPNVCVHQKQASVLDMMRLKEKMDTEDVESGETYEDIDQFLKRPSEREVRTCVKRSNSQALLDKIKRVTSSPSLYAEDYFQQVLQTAIQNYNEGQILPFTTFKTYEHFKNPEKEVGDIQWSNGPIPVIKPPIKANVRILKRKKKASQNSSLQKKSRN